MKAAASARYNKSTWPFSSPSLPCNRGLDETVARLF